MAIGNEAGTTDRSEASCTPLSMRKVAAEYIAAAHDNLRAMQNRLRQMGIFRDLSDDFTIQRLHPPYADIPLKTVEA